MRTALLPDILGEAIYEGDFLLNQQGKVYVVDFTENSFLRQTILRVREVKPLKRGGFGSASSHTYIFPKFAVRIDKDKVPFELRDRRVLFEGATEAQIKKRIDRYLAKGK